MEITNMLPILWVMAGVLILTFQYYVVSTFYSWGKAKKVMLSETSGEETHLVNPNSLDYAATHLKAEATNGGKIRVVCDENSSSIIAA